MPIRINLLAEAQAAAEQRRKDPVKRSVWVACFLVLIVVIWAGKLQMDAHYEKNASAALDADWKGLTAKYTAVTNAQVRTVEVERRLAALDRLSTNRFLWGPVLNTLQKTMLADDSVQVIRVRSEQSFMHETDHTVLVGTDKKKIPAGTVERDALFIEGKDLKPSEQNYTKYKEALGNADFFVKRFGRKDGFVMDGVLGPLTVDPVDSSKQFVTFTLAAHFPEVRRDD